MGQNRNIAERYLFQNVGCFDDMVLALFELPVYMDERLLGRSLGMLRSIF